MDKLRRTSTLGTWKSPSKPVVESAFSQTMLVCFLTIAWCAVIALLHWAAPHFEWLTFRSWRPLAFKGELVILLFAIGNFATKLVMMSEEEKRNASLADVEHRTSKLEIRCAHVIIGPRSQVDAWNAVRHGKDGWQNKMAGGRSGRAYKGAKAYPADAIAELFDAIVPALPGAWPIPLLVWPPSDRDRSAFDPVDAFTNSIRQGFFFVEEHPAERRKSEHLADTIFAMFDDNPALPILVVMAADGKNFRVRADSGVTPNASLMVLVHRERIETLVKPFLIEDVPGRAMAPNAQRDLIRIYRDQVAGDPHHGRSNYWMDMEYWRVHAQAFIKNHPTPGYSPAGIHLPSPWMRASFNQFEKVPSVATLHRPVSVSHGAADLSKDRADALSSAWKAVLTNHPDTPAPQRAVLDEAADERFQDALGDLLTSSNAERKRYLAQLSNVQELTGCLGSSADPTTMALAVEASRQAGDVSAVVSIADGSVSVALIKPAGSSQP